MDSEGWPWGSERWAHGFTARGKAQRWPPARRPFDYSRVLFFLKINQTAVVGAGESVENPLTGSLVLVFSFTAVWEGWLEQTPKFRFSPVSQTWGISFVARDGNCPCLFPVFTCPFTRFSLGRFVNRMRYEPCSPGGHPCRSAKKKASAVAEALVWMLAGARFLSGLLFVRSPSPGPPCWCRLQGRYGRSNRCVRWRWRDP